MKAVIEIIETAVSCGATGYTFSTHPINLQIVKTLPDSVKTENGFGLYPVFPYAQGYVRLANEKGMRGLVEETLSKLSLSDKAKAVFKGGFSALRLDPIGILKAYVDLELAGYLSEKPGNASLQGVLLHEVVTDLCLGLRDIHLLDEFAQHVRDKYHVNPGFVTYNLVQFAELFQEAGITLKEVVIMTPFNSVGYQMSSSRRSCEACLSTLDEANVIAMSTMAGGYLKLDEAFAYIRSLANLSGIAIGVSSKEHAEEAFTKFDALVSGQAELSSFHQNRKVA